MKAWDEERDEADAADEEDLPNLEEMMEKVNTELTEQRDADITFLDDMVAALEEKRIPWIKELKTDVSEQFVHLKMVD